MTIANLLHQSAQQLWESDDLRIQWHNQKQMPGAIVPREIESSGLSNIAIQNEKIMESQC
jgi:hypothetical protein